MIEAKSTAETASANLPLGSVFIKGAELWIGAQGDLLTGIERMMTGWVQRQRQAFEASSRSVKKLYGARDFFDLLHAQQELVSDCLNWTVSELQAVGSDATTITRKAAERWGEPNETLRRRQPTTETRSSATFEHAAAAE
jgi:hypothetical protein